MIVELDSENADKNLTSYVLCLTATPSVANPMSCQVLVYLGDAAKVLDGTGGTFKMKIFVGSQESHELSFTVTSGDTRTHLWSPVFPVVENTEVKVYVLSPNGADTDIDVIAKLYDCFPVTVSAGVAEANVKAMANDIITNDVVAAAAFDTAQFAADFLTNALVADNVFDTEQFVADFLTNALVADAVFDTEQFAADFLTNALVADNVFDTAQFAADFLDNTLIADNALAVEQFKDAFLTAAKCASDFITNAKIADDAFAVEQFKDACLTRDKAPFLTATTGKAELSSLPAVAAAMEDQVQMLFQCLVRNKWQIHKVSAAVFEIRFFNDAGTEIFDRKTCSTDGTDLIFTEITEA